MRTPDGERVLSLRKITLDLKHKTKNLQTSINAPYTFDKIIGHSDSLSKTIVIARSCSSIDSTVLITGESGTGKELFAQAIHNASYRSKGPFIAVNCGAIPKDLVHSELFGYVDGAYTGAKSGGSPGKFELAQGGTIFLDEIGEMPLDAQTSLLRILQESEVIRIGATVPTKINIRIIAATNKNLSMAVSSSTFRQDLYYRLNVISLKIPPLRKRPEDIRLLIHFFTQKISKKLNKIPVQYSPNAIKRLQDYSWPGNVRELENIIERLVSITKKLTIEYNDIPEEVIITATKINAVIDTNNSFQHYSNSLKSQEKTIIEQAIKQHVGNIRKSAETLEISRSNLYLKIKKWHIDINQYRN